MFQTRKGLIVWVSDVKAARTLDRHGTLHYISRKMKYAVLYIHAEREQEVLAQLKRLNFVKKIEPSYRNEIKTEYNSNMQDKTRFYTL